MTRGGAEVVPIAQRAAFKWIDRVHRHNRRPRGWKFGAALEVGGQLVAVACAGRPVARMIAKAEPRTIEITRVATDEAARKVNACSRLYGALCAAAKALGFTKAITYTRVDEPGISPKAAGFERVATVAGEGWDRPGRRREDKHEIVDRVRWERAL